MHMKSKTEINSFIYLFLRKMSMTTRFFSEFNDLFTILLAVAYLLFLKVGRGLTNDYINQFGLTFLILWLILPFLSYYCFEIDNCIIFTNFPRTLCCIINCYCLV